MPGLGERDVQASLIQQMQRHQRTTGTTTDHEHVDGFGHGCGHWGSCDDWDAQYPIHAGAGTAPHVSGGDAFPYRSVAGS